MNQFESIQLWQGLTIGDTFRIFAVTASTAVIGSNVIDFGPGLYLDQGLSEFMRSGLPGFVGDAIAVSNKDSAGSGAECPLRLEMNGNGNSGNLDLYFCALPDAT